MKHTRKLITTSKRKPMSLGSKSCVTTKFWKECKQIGKTTAFYHWKATNKISKIIQMAGWLTLQKTNSKK